MPAISVDVGHIDFALPYWEPVGITCICFGCGPCVFYHYIVASPKLHKADLRLNQTGFVWPITLQRPKKLADVILPKTY